MDARAPDDTPPSRPGQLPTETKHDGAPPEAWPRAFWGSAATADVLPDWLPSGGPAIPPSGRWWDAVPVPSIADVRGAGALRERSGATIEDRALHIVLWLLRVGAAAGWAPAALGVRVPLHGPGGPGPVGAPSTRWLIAPTATCLTNPPLLLDALRHVLPGGTR